MYPHDIRAPSGPWAVPVHRTGSTRFIYDQKNNLEEAIENLNHLLLNPSKDIYEAREIHSSESVAMENAARRSGGGLSESFYRLIMRRNSIYVTFIIAGAFFGERVRMCFLMTSLSLIISST